MSERHKLEEQFLSRYRRNVTMSDFIIAWGKLVESCKHEKTRWIQEVDSEGMLRGDLVKRCYICGTNIDELNVNKKFIEGLLDAFDKSCEEKKLSLAKKETAVGVVENTMLRVPGTEKVNSEDVGENPTPDPSLHKEPIGDEK